MGLKPSGPGDAAENPVGAAHAEVIVAAVQELLESGGYDAVQLREVARRAHVSLATIYRLFPSRADLIVTSIEQWMSTNSYAELAPPHEGESLYDGLMRGLRYVFEPWERNPRMLEAYHRARLDPTGKRLDRQGMNAIMPNAAALLADADPAYVDDVTLILKNMAYSVVGRFAAGNLDITAILPTLERAVYRLTADNETLAIAARPPAKRVRAPPDVDAMSSRRDASARDLFGPAGTPTVAVIGAGFGGIAAGVKLQRAGIHTFTIYESSHGVGGTWWDNTYPGAEVDVGSHLYCFSFKPHNWTRTHARQAELQRYLDDTVDEFGLRPHLQLGATVESATWDDAAHTWELRFAGGRVERCHVLVSAVGFLNVPRYPDWPGLDEFAGPKFHTARWENEHDLTGKVVAVVGTGSSATQVVPAIQPAVGQLYVFQREPGWIMPKGERDFSADDRARFANPWRRRQDRLRQRYLLERSLWRGHLYRPGTKTNEARRQFCLSYIERKFADRPDLRAAVTPTYPYPGKRPIFASSFYPALKQANVELVPRAVASVTATGIVDATGAERAVDVIVLATGFQAANYLARVRITGRDGRTLAEQWAGEPRAYLGITVPNFPNFFMIYGPGTNGGEIVTMLEAQADYAVRAVKRMIRERVTAVEVKPSFEARWNRWLQRTMRGTSWTMSSNYFTSPSGKVVTQWPYGNVLYRVLTKVLGRVSEITRRRNA